MPRKPKSGPPILRIEGLSTVEEPKPVQFVDDWGVMQTAPAIHTPRHIAKVKKAITAELMAAAGAVVLRKAKFNGFREPVELIPKGKRKIAEINGKAVLIDLPKWRRV
jgi:hypothetical protein